MENTSLISWMAWTLPTALFFVFIFVSIAAMGVWEYFSPGGGPRHGIFGLDTTRGDRLFITLLGSCFIFLGWLGVYGTPLWGGLLISLLWGALVFILG
jgi:predicted small integral membrane protein